MTLEPAGQHEASVLQNLFQLYAHDFSEYVPLALAPDGRFDVAVGAKWWDSPDHFPFFIRWGGKLAGFALARRGSRVTGAIEAMDVAEFFVIRGARRNHVGARAAAALFSAFPGAWEIRVRRANVSARTFWSRAVATWIGGPVVSTPFFAEGVDWELLRISSPGDGSSPDR